MKIFNKILMSANALNLYSRSHIFYTLKGRSRPPEDSDLKNIFMELIACETKNI